MSERFLNDRIVLHFGDCRDVLAMLAENSLDACVTDPPYGIQFMGRGWDHGVPDVVFWQHVFRVLKPGAHLVAMGGTRTYHRLACAIEDAGFEIRDTCAYIFGSGFPKSHDVGKRLDASNKRCTCDPVCHMREDAASASVSDQKNTSDILQLLVSEQNFCGAAAPICGQHEGTGTEGQEIRQEQSGMERRCDIPASARQLRERPIREMSAGFDFDGENGRLRDGAPFSDGADDQTAIVADGMRASSRPSTVEQHADQSGTVAMQSEPQERGAWSHCRSCGKPIIPDGLGTALKPAMELLCLARKPLSEPTVAANVLKHGTGALNIDGCRVGFANETDEAESKIKNQHEDFGSAPRQNKIYGKDERPQVNYNPTGRWPANLCHDGSDEVVAAFPESTSIGGQASLGAFRNGDIYGKGRDEREKRDPGYGDSGSAARYFYTAKADADDRLGSKHPTIKPLDLMQWLVRLVCRKGGTVLDPFAGTGTTGEAAWREGMAAVLIEAEPEYQTDIRRRMALVLAGPDERQRESIKAKGLPRDDGPLFAARI